MNGNVSFNVSYDRDSDVLYINASREPAMRGVEDKYGIVWRYDRDGELIGVTVIDFGTYWLTRRELLAGEISKRFHIPAKQAKVVLEHASS